MQELTLYRAQKPYLKRLKIYMKMHSKKVVITVNSHLNKKQKGDKKEKEKEEITYYGITPHTIWH